VGKQQVQALLDHTLPTPNLVRQISVKYYQCYITHIYTDIPVDYLDLLPLKSWRCHKRNHKPFYNSRNSM